MPNRACARCGRNRQERFFSGPRGHNCADCLREVRRRASKDHRLRVTYGITLVEWEAVLEAHRGPDGEIHCAGCNETRSKDYAWSVDHDHKIEAGFTTGGSTPQEAARWSIRGPLCRRCNKVLRDVRDNYMILESLAQYLHWSRERVQHILLGQV